MGRARSCINEGSSTLLYYILIYPYLHNGLNLWGATFQTYMNSWSTLQKKAVRLIVNAPRLKHTMPVFQKLKLKVTAITQIVRLLSWQIYVLSYL